MIGVLKLLSVIILLTAGIKLFVWLHEGNEEKRIRKRDMSLFLETKNVNWEMEKKLRIMSGLIQDDENGIASVMSDENNGPSQQLLAARALIRNVQKGMIDVPELVNFEDEGPTRNFLRSYMYRHRNANYPEILTIIETCLTLKEYEFAESLLNCCFLTEMEESLWMRYYNAMMKLYIMTGKTELAARYFSDSQDFAEHQLRKDGSGVGEYLDNAAMICALTGEFEEAEKYCQALQNYVYNDNKKDSADFFPYLTEIKLLYLEGRREDAAVQTDAAMKIIYQMAENAKYPWEMAYMMKLLEATKTFDISQESNPDEQHEMLSI